MLSSINLDDRVRKEDKGVLPPEGALGRRARGTTDSPSPRDHNGSNLNELAASEEAMTVDILLNP